MHILQVFAVIFEGTNDAAPRSGTALAISSGTSAKRFFDENGLGDGLGREEIWLIRLVVLNTDSGKTRKAKLELSKPFSKLPKQKQLKIFYNETDNNFILRLADDRFSQRESGSPAAD